MRPKCECMFCEGSFFYFLYTKSVEHTTTHSNTHAQLFNKAFLRCWQSLIREWALRTRDTIASLSSSFFPLSSSVLLAFWCQGYWTVEHSPKNKLINSAHVVLSIFRGWFLSNRTECLGAPAERPTSPDKMLLFCRRSSSHKQCRELQHCDWLIETSQRLHFTPLFPLEFKRPAHSEHTHTQHTLSSSLFPQSSPRPKHRCSRRQISFVKEITS